MSGTTFHERTKSSPAPQSGPAASPPRDPRHERQPGGWAARIRDPRQLLLNVLIAVLTLIVGYLLYSLVSRTVLSPPVQPERSGVAAGTTIQLDVLNGCGVPNAGTQFTSYLRARGFDVVEIRNYRTFDVDETLVIDRAGDMNNARKVAYALGIGKEHIIQQMNQDYYVDVSVVIGKDYKSLKPSM